MGHCVCGGTTPQFGVSVDVSHCHVSLIDPPLLSVSVHVEMALTQRRQHAQICSLLQSWEEVLVNLLNFILDCSFISVPGYLTEVYVISMCRGLESLNILFRAFCYLVFHSLPFLSSFSFLSSPFLCPFPSPSFSSPILSSYLLSSSHLSFIFFPVLCLLLSFAANKSFLLGLTILNTLGLLHKYQWSSSCTDLSSIISKLFV